MTRKTFPSVADGGQVDDATPGKSTEKKRRARRTKVHPDGVRLQKKVSKACDRSVEAKPEVLEELVNETRIIREILQAGAAVDPTGPHAERLWELINSATALIATLLSSNVTGPHQQGDTADQSTADEDIGQGYDIPSFDHTTAVEMAPAYPVGEDSSILLGLDMTAWRSIISGAETDAGTDPILSTHFDSVQEGQLHQSEFSGLDVGASSGCGPVGQVSKKRKLNDHENFWEWIIALNDNPDTLELPSISHIRSELISELALSSSQIYPDLSLHSLTENNGAPVELDMQPEIAQLPLVPTPQLPSAPFDVLGVGTSTGAGALLSTSPAPFSLTSSDSARTAPSTSSSPSTGSSPLPEVLALRDSTMYRITKSRDEQGQAIDEVALLVQELAGVTVGGSVNANAAGVAFMTGAIAYGTIGSAAMTNPTVAHSKIGTANFGSGASPSSPPNVDPLAAYGSPGRDDSSDEDGVQTPVDENQVFTVDEDPYFSLRVEPSPSALAVMSKLAPVILTPEEERYYLEKYLGTAGCWCSMGIPAPMLLGPKATRNTLLLNATLAHSFRYMRQRRQGEIFLARAKRIVMTVEEDSMTSARAYFLIGIYSHDQGKSALGQAWSVLGLGNAIHQRLNKPPPSSRSLLAATGVHPPDSTLLNPLQYEFRQRIMWFLYVAATDYLLNFDGESYPDPKSAAFDNLPNMMPSDELWNGLDDLGHPIPGTPAVRIVRKLIAQGVCQAVTLSQPNNPSTLQRRFPSYGFTERCSLYLILNRVQRLVWARERKMEPPQSGDSVAKVQLDLARWDANLPQYLKTSLTADLPQTGTQKKDAVPLPEDMLFHSAHSLRLMFCLTQILLHRSSGVHVGDGTSALSWPSSHSREICYSAARESTHVVSRLLKHNPDCSRINTNAFYAVFQCGAVHALCRYELRNADPTSSFLDAILGPGAPHVDRVSAAIVKSEEGFAVHLETLRRMTHCWSAGANYYTTLRRMGSALM
ncbi:hypothetical protein M427DRAFT_31130 [Gonapodya prolifera JEL478]|uniref:Transcription factor domain-containing protein n=1 Tax=Gonapodya prolifera (strain JEL478) TaxID=1344416 RepID=A0A139AHT7_GONPJ|nr:hypothetical protein M427DRAFT_31130 [Gonapodya prolifera JEL478]|eukprot:KXS16391.1 hypothetical protein M427DRAFT_31130 [Gonapodya prolifera JEL478]